MMSQFIVVEGLEGAGKTNAINTIKAYLADKPIEVVYTREPGGTFLAEKIRKLLITSYEEEALCCESELLLMYASRLQHIKRLIEPALQNNQWVVSDRFNWSSLAYQGGGRSLGFEKVKALNDLIMPDCSPDLLLYLDIDPALGLQRAKQRNALDRIEQETLKFFQRARQIFLDLAKNTANSIVIDAALPIDEVEEIVIKTVEAFICQFPTTKIN